MPLHYAHLLAPLTLPPRNRASAAPTVSLTVDNTDFFGWLIDLDGDLARSSRRPARLELGLAGIDLARPVEVAVGGVLRSLRAAAPPWAAVPEGSAPGR
jgi:hypothetical protein